MGLLRLEVFELPSTEGPGATVVTDIGALEEAKLAAFEKGYSAGWEDAEAAAQTDQTRIGADLARNMQALSFTYHEARAHVLKALEPLLTQTLCKLLPETARAALGPQVVQALMTLAEEMAGEPVRLVLNPADRPAIEGVLADSFGMPIMITEEPSLGEGQVYLRLGETELRIDPDAAARDIAAAVRDYFALLNKEPTDG